MNIKNIINNYGFYIMTSFLFLYIITINIFWFIFYKKLKNALFIIFNNIKSLKAQRKPNKKIKLKRKKKKSKLIENKKKINLSNSNNSNIKFENNLKNNNIIRYFDNNKQTTQNDHDKSSIQLDMAIKFKSYNIKYIKELLELKEFEINLLEYEEALKLDTRNYFQYYLSLLKYNHPIIFSFGTYNDYNSKIIKIFLFFFSFSSDLTINALFFNDDTMHKIYQDKGEYNFLYQIPQILYSALISRFIDTLIKNLALSQDNIIELKQEKWNGYIEKKFAKGLNIITIKIILFFVTSFIILSFSWYYIICFCGIYVNTQIHLIKDSIISLIASLIYPFILYLIPSVFRAIALKVKKFSGKYLYKFSSFLENYII